MTLKETLNKLIKDNNSSYQKLATDLGMKSTGALGNIASRNVCSLTTLKKIVDVFGYQIILRPVAGDNKAERTIILDKVGDEQ